MNHHQALTSRPTKLQAMGLDAVRFWEPRRLVFNFLLVIISAAFIFNDWRHSEIELTGELATLLIAFALVTNLGYCAVYLAEALFLMCRQGAIWRRWRSTVFIVGLIFTALAAGKLFLQIGNYTL